MLREFFYEVAAMDSVAYPFVTMAAFANMCFVIGTGFLKAIARPPPPNLPDPKKQTAAK